MGSMAHYMSIAELTDLFESMLLDYKGEVVYDLEIG